MVRFESRKAYNSHLDRTLCLEHLIFSKDQRLIINLYGPNRMVPGYILSFPLKMDLFPLFSNLFHLVNDSHRLNTFWVFGNGSERNTVYSISCPFCTYLHCSMHSDWEVRWRKISNFFKNRNSMEKIYFYRFPTENFSC